MVLTHELSKKIVNFVKKEPRTVQDIAHFIGKSLVTADSYVEKIKQETGMLNVKVFRGKTRGALKVVYWSYEERIENDELQKELYEQIKQGKRKDDIEAFDIYQFVDKKKKRKLVEKYKVKYVPQIRDLPGFLRQAETEVICFSGNVSWINRTDKGVRNFDVIKELAERGVQIRIICRVDLASIKNIDRINKINLELGREAIEIRHKRQPLRGFIVDNKVISIKEEKKVEKYKPGELEYNQITYYEIFDTAWIDWLKQVFWNLFRYAIPAKKRIDELME